MHILQLSDQEVVFFRIWQSPEGQNENSPLLKLNATSPFWGDALTLAFQ